MYVDQLTVLCRRNTFHHYSYIVASIENIYNLIIHLFISANHFLSMSIVSSNELSFGFVKVQSKTVNITAPQGKYVAAIIYYYEQGGSSKIPVVFSNDRRSDYKTFDCDTAQVAVKGWNNVTISILKRRLKSSLIIEYACKCAVFVIYFRNMIL